MMNDEIEKANLELTGLSTPPPTEDLPLARDAQPHRMPDNRTARAFRYGGPSQRKQSPWRAL